MHERESDLAPRIHGIAVVCICRSLLNVLKWLARETRSLPRLASRTLPFAALRAVEYRLASHMTGSLRTSAGIGISVWVMVTTRICVSHLIEGHMLAVSGCQVSAHFKYLVYKRHCVVCLELLPGQIRPATSCSRSNRLTLIELSQRRKVSACRPNQLESTPSTREQEACKSITNPCR